MSKPRMHRRWRSYTVRATQDQREHVYAAFGSPAGSWQVGDLAWYTDGTGHMVIRYGPVHGNLPYDVSRVLRNRGVPVVDGRRRMVHRSTSRTAPAGTTTA